jgi:hypothetical protein
MLATTRAGSRRNLRGARQQLQSPQAKALALMFARPLIEHGDTVDLDVDTGTVR